MARTRFHTILEGKIRGEIALRTEEVVSGIAHESSYWRIVGRIRALEDVLHLADEVYEDMEGA